MKEENVKVHEEGGSERQDKMDQEGRGRMDEGQERSGGEID